MKYLVDRYKQAKDWNSKQSGGNRKKSAHYDEIDEVLGCRDIVTLQNVQEAGSVSEESDTSKTSNNASVECGDDAGTAGKKEARSAREKTKKREREEEEDDEDRKMLKSALSGVETQRSDMNLTFVFLFQLKLVSPYNTWINVCLVYESVFTANFCHLIRPR